MYTKTVTKVYLKISCRKYHKGLWDCNQINFYLSEQVIHNGNQSKPSKNDYEKLGQEIIENSIENLNTKEDQIRLYNWYVKVYEKGSELYYIGKCVITGHSGIPDTNRISTSNIKTI